MSNLISPFPDKPRIGLVGFFGWGNYGDELFLQQWKRRLDPWFEAVAVNDLLLPPYMSLGADAVAADLDAVIIGGGDIVLPDKSSTLYWNRAWLDRDVYIVGVGVPFHDVAQKAEAIVEMGEFFRHPRVRHISARDEESAAWIRQRLRPHVPVRVHADLAFAPDLPPARDYGEGKTIGLVIRRGRFGAANDYGNLRQLVSSAVHRGYSPKVIVLATGRRAAEDRECLDGLAIDAAEVIESDDIDALSSAVGGLDVLLSLKLHGAIVAARYGVPTIALEGNTKNRMLLSGLGLEDLVSDLVADPHLASRLDSAERLRGGLLERVRPFEESAREAVGEVVTEVVERHARPRRRSLGQLRRRLPTRRNRPGGK
jgi:polysaccharide pyruvyl transferase WcaK-like protein